MSGQVHFVFIPFISFFILHKVLTDGLRFEQPRQFYSSFAIQSVDRWSDTWEATPVLLLFSSFVYCYAKCRPMVYYLSSHVNFIMSVLCLVLAEDLMLEQPFAKEMLTEGILLEQPCQLDSSFVMRMLTEGLLLEQSSQLYYFFVL